MTRWLRHAVWFNRLVLLAGTVLFGAIALRYLVHPVAAGAPFGIALGSAAAVTIARVGLGGFPLALAVVFLACQGRGGLLVGLRVLATVAIVVTAVRIAGIAVDGPAAFSLRVLRPEIALSLLSVLAALLEARRRRAAPGAAPEKPVRGRVARQLSEQP